MSGTGLFGLLENFGSGELVAIVLVALVFLGPDRIPEMARGLGRLIHKVRTMTEGIQGDVSSVMNDPAMKPLRELGEFAARPRQKLTEYAVEAEAEAWGSASRRSRMPPMPRSRVSRAVPKSRAVSNPPGPDRTRSARPPRRNCTMT